MQAPFAYVSPEKLTFREKLERADNWGAFKSVVLEMADLLDELKGKPEDKATRARKGE